MVINKKKKRIILLILLVLILSFIWINSMLSKETSKAFSDFILHLLFQSERTGNTGEGFPIRKIAHFLEFAVLGADVFLLFDENDSKKRILQSIIFCAVCASIDESIQIFSHRGNSILDVMLDTCGSVFGILISQIIILFLNKKNRKN